MEPMIEIAFDCLPLRSVGRVDVPIDASPAFRARLEHLQRAIKSHPTANSYFLYNTQCTYHLANSEIANMLRFTFDGTIVTDRSDCQADRADLEVILVAETCGGVSTAALEWLRGIVERAVLVEFDRFITAGKLAARVAELGDGASAQSISGLAGLGV